MKVKDLILQLQKLDPELPVQVSNYNKYGGYSMDDVAIGFAKKGYCFADEPLKQDTAVIITEGYMEENFKIPSKLERVLK